MATPSFNPQMLLNPKAAKQRALNEKQSVPQVNGSTVDNTSPSPSMGIGSMIEKMYNVEQRERQRPIKRQKRDTNSEHPDDDVVTVSKNTSTFQSGGQGTGELGEYMKQQRQKGAADAGEISQLSTIDLTNEDDGDAGAANEDDDVVIVEDKEEEVCLGRIENALVSAHKIPTAKMTNVFGAKITWPPMRVQLIRRVGTNNHVIDVVDPNGKTFGAVDARVAVPLSTLMDGAKTTKVRLQARLEMKKREPYEFPGQAVSLKWPINIIIYAPRRMVKGIGRLLGAAQVWLRDPAVLDRGIQILNPHRPNDFTPKKTPAAATSGQRFSSGAVVITRSNEQVREDVFKVFDSLKDTKDLPELDASGDVITPLLHHQKQALYFMTQRERHHTIQTSTAEEGSKGPTVADNTSIWEKRMTDRGSIRWFNVITGEQQRSEPKPSLGGILADVMGLGKTLNVLALTMNSKAESRAWARHIPEADDVDADGKPLLQSRATLLICPVTTIFNWKDQIETHLKAKSLKYYIYQGPKRTDDPDELKGYDMVITSYSTASADYVRSSRSRGGSPLYSINWFRIVLDEAHIIRTQNTNQSKAACTLHAQRRWCLTGTPVQNRLDDLAALIKFLRIKPFDEKGAFATYISAPLKSVDVDAVPKLRILVDSITLRRLKDKIQLPERTVEIVRLPMERDEQALYDQFNRDSHRKLDAVVGQNDRIAGKAYAHILKSILRLRLLAASGGDLLSDADWDLAKGFSEYHVIDLEDENDERPDRTAREAFEMLDMMEDARMNVCSKCARTITATHAENAEMEDSYENDDESDDESSDTIGFLTPCNQLICPQCIADYKAQMAPRLGPDNFGECSICNQYIRMTVFELKRSDIENDRRVQQDLRERRLGKRLVRYSGPHSKTRRLIECIRTDDSWSKAHPNERPIKSVVFSEWVNHLDLIEMALQENKIGWKRIDGSMSIKSRTDALQEFETSRDFRVLLISIKAGGLGINLTVASRVYMMQPNYNPGIERQAIERVHRLGQTREVIIRRFITKDSIEEKVLELQARKERLADFSVERGVKMDRADAAKKKLEDLRSLFR